MKKFQTIDPSGEKGYTHDKSRTCRGCGQQSIETVYQNPIVPGRPGHLYGNCMNPDCVEFHQTHTLDRY